MAERSIQEIDLSKDYTGEMVSEAEYLAVFADHGYEWLNGRLQHVGMPSRQHNAIIILILEFVGAYATVSQSPISLLSRTYLLHLPQVPAYRIPDAMFLLNDSNDTATVVTSPQICLEVVSRETGATDYGYKRFEYEDAGVEEYWIVDPTVKQTTFLRRNDDGRLARVALSGQFYHTPLLPKFQLDTNLLWRTKMPDVVRITETVRQMWESDNDAS